MHTNALYKVPEFTRVFNSTEIYWNIDLRCKNFTFLSDLSDFVQIGNINNLDLSFNLNTSKNICKYYDEKLMIDLPIRENFLRLEQFGIENYYPEYEIK